MEGMSPDPLSPETLYNSLAAFMQSGGVFMWFIALIWGVGLVIAVDRYLKYKKYHVDGPSLMNELQRYILSNDIQGAIRACSNSTQLLPKVLKSALKRASKSQDQIQNAIDATALEVIPRVERRLGYLQLIANISTLCGLLGTIKGLMASFSAIDKVDPAQKAEILASGISQAMNTTFLGLLAAISIMMLHAVLASKSEEIINDIDEFSVKIMDVLGTKKESES
jgi:biopolymer transport protein ExbB/TolQ